MHGDRVGSDLDDGQGKNSAEGGGESVLESDFIEDSPPDAAGSDDNDEEDGLGKKVRKHKRSPMRARMELEEESLTPVKARLQNTAEHQLNTQREDAEAPKAVGEKNRNMKTMKRKKWSKFATTNPACPSCGARCENESAIQLHMYQKHDLLWCQGCKFKADEATMTEHLASEHGASEKASYSFLVEWNSRTVKDKDNDSGDDLANAMADEDGDVSQVVALPDFPIHNIFGNFGLPTESSPPSGGPGGFVNESKSTWCDICKKDLCQSWYKKAHMLKKHGIGGPSASTPTTVTPRQQRKPKIELDMEVEEIQEEDEVYFDPNVEYGGGGRNGGNYGIRGSKYKVKLPKIKPHYSVTYSLYE